MDLDTIRRYFGEEITHLVDGLTKIAQISNISREEQQAENVRKMLLAMVDDVRVVLVKLADRLQHAHASVSEPGKAQAHRRRDDGDLSSRTAWAWVNCAASSRISRFDISIRRLSRAWNNLKNDARERSVPERRHCSYRRKDERGGSAVCPRRRPRKATLFDLEKASRAKDQSRSGLRSRRRQDHHAE